MRVPMKRMGCVRLRSQSRCSGLISRGCPVRARLRMGSACRRDEGTLHGTKPGHQALPHGTVALEGMRRDQSLCGRHSCVR